MAGLIDRLRSRLFGYDAIEDDKRRKSPETTLRTEDGELDASGRRKLVSTTRNIQRNFAIAAWMIRKHLDYVSTFSFQARTGDEQLDTQIESLMRWWDKAQNFDIAGRHSRGRFMRLAEARRTLDGDVAVMKLADGHVQAIEGDRIRNPYYSRRGGAVPVELTHGVQTDRAGRAIAYALHNRTGNYDAFEFDRMVPAENLLLHGYFDRFDQVRGISPLTPALNTLRDTYEGLTYALAKAKVSQLFALAFYREASDSIGDVTAAVDDAGAEDKSGYEVDFAKGPALLDLEPGDRAEFLESKQPSTEFKEFIYTEIALALKALDIPFSFYNEAFTNYSGSREALLLYDQSAEEKRKQNRELLDALTRWRMTLWVLDGRLALPAGMAIDQVTFDWIHAGLPWIDPLKETDADIQAVGAGFDSTPRVCKRLGRDAWEIADEEAEYQAYRQGKGLSGPPERKTPQPVQTESQQ